MNVSAAVRSPRFHRPVQVVVTWLCLWLALSWTIPVLAALQEKRSDQSSRGLFQVEHCNARSASVHPTHIPLLDHGGLQDTQESCPACPACPACIAAGKLPTLEPVPDLFYDAACAPPTNWSGPGEPPALAAKHTLGEARAPPLFLC